MAIIECTHRPAPADCRKAGDFTWRLCTERGPTGYCVKARKPAGDERPTHLVIALPSIPLALTVLPISPEPGDAAQNWLWDGNLERPTLGPQIDTRDDKGQGWCGYLVAGKLVD